MPRTNKPLKVIAVASGKGGVGKTNVSVNLAVGLARLGREVMLFDADLGLANVDLLLGMRPERTLHDLVTGAVDSLDDVLVQGPDGVKVVPSASGIAAMANLTPAEHAGLIHAFSAYRKPLDVLIVDTAAGLQESVTSFCRAVQETLVVVCDEPASITDAYALIKVLTRDHGVERVRILANMVNTVREGQRLYEKMARVTDHFLCVELDFMGLVPRDDALRRAVNRQQPVVEAFPDSRSAQAFRMLAQKIDKWPMPRSAGHLEFFAERLVGRAGGWGGGGSASAGW